MSNDPHIRAAAWSDRNLTKLRGTSDEMHFRNPAITQIDTFDAVARALVAHPEVTVQVTDTHTSKSVHLPVMHAHRMMIVDSHATNRAVWWLDNFHELNVHYQGPPVTLAPEECGYRKMTRAEYCDHIEKAEGYSWRGWSPAEILDERISRVKIAREDGSTYWSTKTFDAKERWQRRFTSAEWLERDWSHNRVLGGIHMLMSGAVPHVWVASRAFVNHAGFYDPFSDVQPAEQMFSFVFESRTIADRIPLLRKLLGLPESGPDTIPAVVPGGRA